MNPHFRMFKASVVPISKPKVKASTRGQKSSAQYQQIYLSVHSSKARLV